MSTAIARDSQTFVLPDGRLLGYAEYGCPSGYPVLFFHGFPSSRLEAFGADKIATRRRLRIIALDRPSFGLSTPQPHRRITDWPADVAAFTTHIGLPKFAILGGSGGGPYALACADALPRSRLSAVGLMASAVPWNAGTQDMPRGSRALVVGLRYWPSAVRAVSVILLAVAKWLVTTGPVTRWIDAWLEALKLKAKREPPDVEDDSQTKAETTAEARERLLRIMFAGFAQGVDGFIQEANLLTDDWGFRFEDIDYNPILLWHGAEDINAPARLARYMTERLPHGVLREFEGDDHFAMAHHIEEVLSDLVTDKMVAEHDRQESD